MLNAAGPRDPGMDYRKKRQAPGQPDEDMPEMPGLCPPLEEWGMGREIMELCKTPDVREGREWIDDPVQILLPEGLQFPTGFLVDSHCRQI